MNIQELMANPLYRRRKWTNRVMLVLAGLAIVVGLFWLSWIMWTLFSKGLAALSPTLFTEITPPAGETGGGLANAILGSADGGGGNHDDHANRNFGRDIFGRICTQQYAE